MLRIKFRLSFYFFGLNKEKSDTFSADFSKPIFLPIKYYMLYWVPGSRQLNKGSRLTPEDMLN